MKKKYAYHKPGPLALEKINALREKFSEMEEMIETFAPESRERSLAIANLEQAASWAIKSVVRNEPESEAQV